MYVSIFPLLEQVKNVLGCFVVVARETGVDVNVELKYHITTTTCDKVKVTLVSEIRTRMSGLNAEWDGQLCDQSDCSDVNVVVTCNPLINTESKTTVMFALKDKR